jgi:trimeric autotransporter adhesin
MNKITLGFFKTKSKITIKTVFVLFAVLLMNTQTSWGQLLQWNTFGNLGTETTEPITNTNIGAANLTLGPGIAAAANGNRFGGNGWFNAGNTLAEAVAGNDYIQFIVKPNAGVSFTPTSLVFIWDFSGTGPKNVTLRSSNDNFTADLGTLSAMTASTSAFKTITISGLTNITAATTFRLYGYGATATAGTGGFDCTTSLNNVVLNGTTTGPTIILSPSTLAGFATTTTAPSSAQTINVSAANLTADVTTNTLTNLEISTSPSSGFGTSLTIPHVSGSVALTPIYVRFKAGVAVGALSEVITFTSGTSTQLLSCIGGVYTNYYYNGSGALETLGSWGTNLNGTGTAPTSFTAANQLFEIRNTTAVALSNPWTVGITPVGVNGSKVRLGNNSEAAITLTLNSLASIGPAATGNFDVATPISGNQTVIYKGINAISFGNIFDNDLAVIYDGVTQSSSTTKNFGTVSLINASNVTFSATPVIKNINVDATSTLVAPTNNSSFITIPSGGSLTVNGIITIPRQSGFVSSNLVTPNTSPTGTNIQFLGAENLTLGANSTVDYTRGAANPQIVDARTDYKNLNLGGTTPKTIVGNTTVAGTLTIVSGSGLVTVNSGFNLTVDTAIANSGTLTIENDANLIQTAITDTNPVTGTTIVNRNSNSLFRLDYTLWSSPVTGAQTLLNFSPLTVATRFYDYDTNLNLYTAVPDPSTTTFVAGKGNLIRMPDTGSANYVAGTETLTYNGTFTGVPNNGNVQVVLSGFNAKYNLVGNPYPSTINADAFIDHNEPSVIESTIYFWRKKNNPLDTSTAYATYNLVGGVGAGSGVAGAGSEVPNGTIQVGQGFFVQAKFATTAGNFFTNAMRLPSSSTQFFKTKKVVNKDRIWLNLTNTSGVFSQMLVGYLADATSGLDRYDGKYINDSPIALTSNINNEEYTIQGRPAFDAADVVALNFKTDVSGDYTIAIDHVDGLFSGSQDIYLVDSKTGTETNLKTSSYTFTAAAAVDNTRFSLKFQKTLSLDAQELNDNSVIVYKNGGVIYVNSGAKTINNIKVFDILGRVVAERNNVKANTASIQNLRASNQVLIVKVTTDDNQVISKKVEN